MPETPGFGRRGSGQQAGSRRRITRLAPAVLSAVLILAGAASALHGQAQDQVQDRAVGPGPAESDSDPLEPTLEVVPDTAPEAAPPDWAAVLQGLDKTTARVSTFEAPIDRPARFGTLRITARACEKKPPTEPPESAAFLEIVDVRPDSPAVEIFSGWMFASSPAISALEHPVYDVWVIDCRQPEDSGVAAPAESAAVPDDPTGDDEAFPEDPEGEAVPESEVPAADQ